MFSWLRPNAALLRKNAQLEAELSAARAALESSIRENGRLQSRLEHADDMIDRLMDDNRETMRGLVDHTLSDAGRDPLFSKRPPADPSPQKPEVLESRRDSRREQRREQFRRRNEVISAVRANLEGGDHAGSNESGSQAHRDDAGEEQDPQRSVA